MEVGREFLILSSLTDLSFAELFHWGLLRSKSLGTGRTGRDVDRVRRGPNPGDQCSRLTLSENYRLMGMLAEAEPVLEGVPLDEPRVIAAHARIALDRNEGDPSRAVAGRRGHPKTRHSPSCAGPLALSLAGTPQRPDTSSRSPTTPTRIIARHSPD